MTMPNDPIEVPLDLDASGYVSGIQSAIAPTTALSQAVGQVHAQARATRGIWDYVTPSRVAVAGMTAFTAQAAVQQKQLAALSATRAVTGQSATQLAAGERALARELPGGQQQANALVQTYQQLGLTRQAQIGQIRELSKESVRLAAATGEVATQMAIQKTQVDRQFGSLAPTRVKALDDSLVSVQKKIGGTASGILSFADAIGPFAKQAGIGETAVLGISGAFSKMGADGFGATTAISKVIQDLNRSVRDGTNEMSGYANAVGMTRTEFAALYKEDPAQALSRIITALGKPGPQPQRQLEQLGFEGIRTQRYLSEISQSGGIEKAIAVAQQGYNSGATQRASSAAFNNLQDDLQKLSTTAGQTTEALGTPFLGALQNITHVATGFASMTAQVMGSAPVQMLLKGTSYAALGVGGAALLARAGVRGLIRGGTLAMGTGMVTRGPIRGFLSGLGTGRGAAMGIGPVGLGTKGLGSQMYEAERIQAEMLGLGYTTDQARASAPMGGVLTGPATERTYGYGARAGTALQNAMMSRMDPAQRQAYIDVAAGRGSVSSEGLSMRQRLWRGVATPLSLGYEGMMRSFVQHPSDAAIAKLGVTDVGKAQGVFKDLRDRQSDIWSTYKSSDMGPAAFRQMRKEWTAAVAATSKEISDLGGSFGALRRTVSATASSVGSLTKFGASTFGGAAGALAKGLGPMLGVTAGIWAGTKLYSTVHGNFQADTQEGENTRNQGIYGTLDKYNEAMGHASQSTTTLAETVDSATQTMQRSVKGFADAAKVTQTDMNYANDTMSKQIYHFNRSSSVGQLAAQIATIGGAGGMTPDQVQAIKADLIRSGVSQETAAAVLSQVTLGAKGGVTAPLTRSQLVQGVGNVPGGGTQNVGWGSAGGFGAHIIGNIFQSPTTRGTVASLSALKPGGASDVGSSWNKVQLNKAGKDQVDAIAEGVASRYNANKNMYGETYARQQEIIDMDSIVNQAISQGMSDDYIVSLTRKFMQMLNIKGAEHTSVGTRDIQNAGGFVPAAAHHHGGGGAVLNEAPTSVAGGRAAPVNGVVQASPLVGVMKSAGMQGSALGQLLSNTAPQSPLSRVVQESAYQTGPQAEQRFVEGSYAASSKAGESLTQLTDSAGKLAARIDDDSDALFQHAMALRQYAQDRNMAQTQPQGRGAQLGAQLKFDTQTMSIFKNSTSDAGRAAYRGAQQDMLQRQQDFYSMLQQRLQAQREYQVNVGRAEYDFHTSQFRAEQDYQTSVTQATQDFHTQMTRSQQDYLISRNREYRDYNIQLERQVDDATKTMLQPFQRLTTQQIWDTRDLMSNMINQQKQMAQQLGNLRTVRHMGLSQQVIDMLGLTDPNNAQQLASMVNDLTNDPKLVQELNRNATARKGLAGQLLTQGIDYRRQRVDFQKQLSDQSADYHKSMARTEADFTRSMERAHAAFIRQMNRSETDFQLQLARGAEDIHRADEEISGSMQDLLKMTAQALNGQAVNFMGHTTNYVQAQIDAVKANVTNMSDWLQGQGWTPPSGQATTSQTGYSASGDPIKGGRVAHNDNNAAQNELLAQHMAANYGWTGGQWDALDWLWNQESGFRTTAGSTSKAYGIPQSDPGYNMRSAGQDWETNPETQIKWGLDYIKHRYGTPEKAVAHKHATDTNAPYNASRSVKNNQPGGWYAEGSIFRTPKVIGVGERGDEMVLPLNGRGVEFLANAFGKAIGHDDYRAMNGRAHAMHIHYHHDTVTYDHSVLFTGPLNFEGVTNLDELADEAEARVARDNFTAARGRP